MSKIDTSKPGGLFEYLEAHPFTVSQDYPARVIPWQLFDSVDALVTNTRKTGDEPEDHWIWEGKTNDRGIPVRYGKPVAWFFYEMCEGYWHREAGLVRQCSEKLCVKPTHYEIVSR